MTEPITWTLRTVDISTLTDYYKNPRSLSKAQFDQLKTSLDKFGMIDKPIINLDSANTVIGGHQRLHILRADKVKRVECWYPSRLLTDKEVEELNIRLNKNTGNWDFDALANRFEVPDLLEWGFDERELQLAIPIIDDGNFSDSHNYRMASVNGKIVVGFGRFSALMDAGMVDRTIESITEKYGDNPEAAILALCQELIG